MTSRPYPDPDDLPESGIPQPTTDVATVAPPVVIPHPATGEAIEVIATTATDALADVRDRLSVAQSEMATWKQQIDGELARRMDYEGQSSAEVQGAYGSFKITVPKPTKTTWDGRAVYVALRRLVRDGLISKERMDEAVRRQTVYATTHGSLKRLLTHADERVRDAVAGCQIVEEQQRRASVTRRYGADD